ncbi:MAG: cadmium-translocating P-type ATPase [Deltaproteobacteria bacterium]|nr:cadmium-translocating P-type ATPase [Deltaproteobacteria bacterium]
MAEIITERFSVKNLDCAACAAKIENGLKNLDGVDDAVLDFANLTLHVSARDINRIVEEVRRIEPEVELVPKSEKTARAEQTEGAEEPGIKKDLIFLGAASVLFVLQLFFEGWFHQTPLARLEILLVFTAYFLAGWNVLAGALRTVLRRVFFDENVLMVIATAGAIAIHAYSEAIGVMIFFKIGELLQNLAVSRSRRSIRSLLAAKPNTANVKANGGLRQVPPESVRVGDVIVVKPGEKVPLDGEVISGSSQLDTSALTGEPVPLMAGVGDTVMAGQVNLSDAISVRVTKPFEQSSIARVLDLVENAAARKAGTEKFITRFARYYTPAVVAAALCIAVFPPLILQGAKFETWIYRSLVLLVISCPCALVVSIPLGYFGGIGVASKNGILVKGSNYIDALSKLETVVFDKTGTLTEGLFKVRDIVATNGYSPECLLEYAAAAEYHSNHPIAKSILAALAEKGKSVEISRIKSHSEIPGSGVEVQMDTHHVLVGNDALMHREHIDHDRCVFEDTVVHIAIDRTYAGYITVGDRIRAEAAETISQLRKSGIKKIMMLTGDNRCAAEFVAKKLQIDAYFAELLPEDKVAILDKIENEKPSGSLVAFVGDGINDAPVIARSDVGIAMGGLGSDAAIETADVVLMTDSPRKIVDAIKIGRRTRRIVWQNIVLSLSIKGVFVIFGAWGLATMWEAVFADMGTALLAVINSTRILSGGK